jgi:hypothetical protein
VVKEYRRRTKMTDFIIYADEDWPQDFQYVDSSQSGIDITDAIILFVATPGGQSPTLIKKSTTDETIIIADQIQSTGIFTVLLAGADTAGKGSATYQYEIKLTLTGVARVIYPAPGATATFAVDASLTDGVEP